MASTPDGRRLTAQHKLDQMRNATRAATAVLLTGGILDVARLDETDALWQLAVLTVTHRPVADAQQMALDYLTAYRKAEAPTHAAGMPLVVPDHQPVDLRWVTPTIKKRISEGVDPASAKQKTIEQVASAVHRNTLIAGRNVVDRSALANPHSTGWRRVSDGNPCAFCAMLVTRGPAYKTAQTAGSGRRWHLRCGCSVEEVFGEWVPTPQEQRFIDAYDNAAVAASEAGEPRTEETVLYRMREQSGFTDSKVRPPATAVGGSGGAAGRGGQPPGILGPESPSDRFGPIGPNGWEPPAWRSEITLDEATLAKIVDKHAWPGKDAGTPFPAGWREDDIAAWIQGIIDRPSSARERLASSFALFGMHRSEPGVVVVRKIVARSWEIVTGYPLDTVDWDAWK